MGAVLWRAVTLLVIWVTTAQAQASFDCSRASTPVEITICNSHGLSMLDLQMSTAFQIANGQADDAGSQEIIQKQRAWLARRDACRTDGFCIAEAIRDQTVVLWELTEN